MDVLGDDIEDTLSTGCGYTSGLIFQHTVYGWFLDKEGEQHTCSVKNAIGNASYSILNLPDNVRSRSSAKPNVQ